MKSGCQLAGVSVQFLMVGETKSMVGYHLIVEGHSIQLGSGGRVSLQQVLGSVLIITIILILMIIFSEFLTKWFLNKNNVYIKLMILST